MTSEERVVFDTNVIISALLFHESVPGQAFVRALQKCSLLVSKELVQELGDVLARERFTRYITREERERFLEALIQETELIETTETVKECRDPKDDKVLELAISGNALYIVTGDKDLLEMDPFRGITIFTPADFLNLMG